MFSFFRKCCSCLSSCCEECNQAYYKSHHSHLYSVPDEQTPLRLTAQDLEQKNGLLIGHLTKTYILFRQLAGLDEKPDEKSSGSELTMELTETDSENTLPPFPIATLSRKQLKIPQNT